MKKTEHYRLNQWELSDRVLMNDFNSDNLLLDAALAALSGSLDAKDAAQSAALASVRDELTRSISGVNTALGDRITNLDAKQTNALSAAKTQLNTTITNTKKTLESSITSLDEKRQGLLDAARAALEAEDRRLDGCKLQWYHAGHGELNLTQVTGPHQMPLGVQGLGEYLMVVFDVQINCKTMSPLGFEDGSIYTKTIRSTDEGMRDNGMAPASKGMRVIGFPLKNPDATMLTFNMAAPLTVGTSPCTWGKFTGLTFYASRLNEYTTVQNIQGTVDVYGIR